MPTVRPIVLIAPSSFGDCGERPLHLLKKAGFDIRLNPFRRKLERAEVVELANGCLALIAGVEPLDRAVLEKLPALKCISRCGAGMDNVDLNGARELGIEVLSTPDGPTRAVAELTVGLILSLARGIAQSDRAMRAGKWEKRLGILMEDKVVGIIGLGRIGRAVALLLQAIGCRIVGFDVRVDEDWARHHHVTLQSLPDLLKNADVVSLHASIKPGAPPILGRPELAIMKPASFVVNLSRGDLVDESALVDALKKGALAGAALDVFTKEPYNGPLLGFDNVVLSPHVGSYAREARLGMEVDAVRNLLKGLGMATDVDD